MNKEPMKDHGGRERLKLTTTAAKGAREKPFPSLSIICNSVAFLAVKHRTRTATPTADSAESCRKEEIISPSLYRAMPREGCHL